MFRASERPDHLPCSTARSVVALNQLLMEVSQNNASPRYDHGKIAQVPDSIRVTRFLAGMLWTGKSCSDRVKHPFRHRLWKC